MNSKAFSLVELLAVLMILSIVAGFVAFRSREDTFVLGVEAGVLKANIRYVRHLALVNDIHAWEIRFLPDRYILQRNGSPAGLSFPGENDGTYRLPPGIRVSVSNLSTGADADRVRWDKWGRPAGGGDIRLTLDDAVNGGEIAFRINRETGRIQ